MPLQASNVPKVDEDVDSDYKFFVDREYEGERDLSALMRG